MYHFLKLQIMKTLEQRLHFLLDRLFAEKVFLKKFNESPFFFDELKDSLTMQLKTSYLSMSELKVMNTFCSFYGLDYSISYLPDNDGNCLSIIIEDVKL